ncbi:MAG: ABC transporter permease, partial [Flavobacteriaceae bacterium]|nr:ABC transporter permease [Flavobacteriaceae bacterium]
LALRKPLHIFLAVQKALFLRELNTKISVAKLGFFWLFFEPFAQISIFILIRVVIMGRSEGSNFDYAVFMGAGFIAFNMFRHILNGSASTFKANKALFSYKQVKPMDTILARVLVQVFLTGIIVFIFVFIGFLFEYNIEAENILMVTFGYLWLMLFSFSLGLLVAIGNTFFVSVGKFVNLMSFGLLIFSAVFFPIISIPPEAQEILLYNPLVHFMEMIHGFYLYELDDRFVDYEYMALWTITPLFMGTWLYIRLEKKIIAE